METATGSTTVFRAAFDRLQYDARTVWGYASTGRTDTFDTIFEPSWWSNAVHGYLQDRSLSAMHKIPDVGEVIAIEIRDEGLWVGAHITDNDTWQRITDGEYNGFSIEAWPDPKKAKTEIVDGREVVRFAEFYLVGITIGYPAANPDAVFQLIERLSAQSADRMPHDDSSPWNWDWAWDADAIIDHLGWKGLDKACLYKNPDADPEMKTTYQFPVAKLKNGQMTVFWNGVRAAMAVLNGGRGGIDISDADRKKVYAKIKKLYAQFNQEPPELRLGTGGNTMSKFTETIIGVVKRLTGKDPDEAATKEINQLEKELAGEHAAQIDDLTGKLGTLTERLDAIEKGEGEKGADSDQGKQIKDITERLQNTEERLEKTEARIATSQQPGEGNSPAKTGSNGMNEYIRASLGR